MFERMIATRHARERQGGQVLVLFTLVLVVLLLASALAVDYGAWLVTKRSYQNVADAAALAGAQQLTRSLTPAKRSLARQAAWQSVKSQLGLGLDPATQAGANEATAYVENGYQIWVASPPEDANAGCSSNCPYPGHVSGPGVVFVRVQRAGQHFLSRIAFSTDTPVVAWATAGRFPQNFAVEALCDPNAGGGNCIVQGANVKIDGNNSLLAVSTGDLGSNSWTRTSGTGSAIGLGTDSNGYMGTFEDCWDATGNQCNLYTYSGGAVDYSSPRNASPLGASIVDPAYPAPPINSTTTPNECNGAGTVQLASILESGSDAHAVDGGLPQPDVDLAAARLPATPPAVQAAAPKPQISGTVNNSSGTVLSGISVTAVSGGNTYTDTTSASGVYTLKNVNAGTYTITATDPSGVYHGGTTSVTVAATDVTAPLITLQKNPVISGTIRDSGTGTGISGVTVTITGVNLGGSWTGTTNGSGVYSIIVQSSDRFSVAGAKLGYVSSSGNLTPGIVPYDGSATVNFDLTPAPASLTGSITDSVTGLGIQGITVTLTPGGSTATTDTTGTYNFSSLTQGTYTATLTGVNMSTLSGLWGAGTAIDGYVTAAPSSPATPLANLAVFGATTQNFQLWPKGCSSSNQGSWSCSYPASNNCPATTNRDAANVTCAFTQANAIRPGTYTNISIDGCAWIDPKGGPSGLATGQSAGVVHVKGTLSMSSDSYLFGDGVTIVMDQGASVAVNNGGGFVLNYGTLHSTPANTGTACDLGTIKEYGDGYSPCFRTSPSTDAADYAYAAWTSKGHDPWACSGTQASPPSYSTSCVNVGQELGVTWYLYGTPSGAGKRFSLSTANMGYLFNGVLYGPNDNIELGGGKDGQSAAGQIVGYTIEYHGGTKIIQRWYGDPVDGPPFLIEPILGECVVPVNVCS